MTLTGLAGVETLEPGAFRGSAGMTLTGLGVVGLTIFFTVSTTLEVVVLGVETLEPGAFRGSAGMTLTGLGVVATGFLVAGTLIGFTGLLFVNGAGPVVPSGG